jgi:hypothetical protein
VLAFDVPRIFSCKSHLAMLEAMIIKGKALRFILLV